ncbi:LysM peptidoglycan-binding domain-containing protein [Metabacillus malikii]|uniref:LysM repeat protein n=1 Tax=Metabacillus malikii TaxID=1504265 RepID=A0ABT9ZKV5_9BACI|nr:LysM peptidoglycan-binding domain-containing protein [Metabacillus malikii]MDQ0232929.1 LysM repeat protein [Metabacillus malikii]
MSDYDRNPDQAENLRTRMIDDFKEVNGEYPPRSEVHKDKEKKTNVKLRYPLISLLAGLFILLPILVLTISLYYSQQGNERGNNNNDSDNKVYYTNDSEDESESLLEQMPTEEKEVTSSESEDDSGKNNILEDGAKNEQLEKITKQEQEVEQRSPEEDDEIVNENPEVEVNESGKVLTHTVSSDDTLFKIAIKYYNSRAGEDIIRKYNGLNGDEIFVGQKLKIPLQ